MRLLQGGGKHKACKIFVQYLHDVKHSIYKLASCIRHIYLRRTLQCLSLSLFAYGFPLCHGNPTTGNSAPDLEVSALGTFESHRMPGARGRETCAPSGEFGGCFGA